MIGGTDEKLLHLTVDGGRVADIRQVIVAIQNDWARSNAGLITAVSPAST